MKEDKYIIFILFLLDYNKAKRKGHFYGSRVVVSATEVPKLRNRL